VPAQTADAQCDDGGEANGFEEQGDEKHGCWGSIISQYVFASNS
jgi:hypothetical protein